jgi:hypothetical protein
MQQGLATIRQDLALVKIGERIGADTSRNLEIRAGLTIEYPQEFDYLPPAIPICRSLNEQNDGWRACKAATWGDMPADQIGESISRPTLLCQFNQTKLL